ncbi:MAG TPA: sigma-70 family RNA polymerase sigma factor [Gemmatimonadaceae bacterium]|nr:sigma-70 family RNA polymerase sigma factor [Gemmatimonadaceae bacterium]
MATPAEKLSDTDAIADLYRRHAGALMAVAYRLLLSRADAEDVVHDLFVGLPEALHKYEERGSMEHWLRKITVRLALGRLRARREVMLDTVPEPVAITRDPVARVAMERALSALSPSLRAVLVLREIEGFSHAEIATMLGISVAASEVRLHRALRQMRALLSEEG